MSWNSENHRRNKALSLSLSPSPRVHRNKATTFLFIQCVLRSISEPSVGCREPMFRFGLMDTPGGYLSVRFNLKKKTCLAGSTIHQARIQRGGKPIGRFRNPNIPQHLCLSRLETNCYRIFVQSSKPTSSTILSFSFMTNFMIFHG